MKATYEGCVYFADLRSLLELLGSKENICEVRERGESDEIIKNAFFSLDKIEVVDEDITEDGTLDTLIKVVLKGSDENSAAIDSHRFYELAGKLLEILKS